MRAFDAFRACAGFCVASCSRPLRDAQRFQKCALCHRARKTRAAAARRFAERAKSTCAERSAVAGSLSTSRCCAFDRLQGFAEASACIAIVDDQRRAAIARDGAGDLFGDRLARRGFIDATASARRAVRALRRPGTARRERESRAAPSRQRHHAFAPAALGLHILPDRQGIEEFVGDEKERPSSTHRSKLSLTSERHVGNPSAFLPALCAAPDLPRPAPRRVRREIPASSCGAQRIRHQRAASGSELDQTRPLPAFPDRARLAPATGRSIRRTSG